MVVGVEPRLPSRSQCSSPDEDEQHKVGPSLCCLACLPAGLLLRQNRLPGPSGNTLNSLTGGLPWVSRRHRLLQRGTRGAQERERRQARMRTGPRAFSSRFAGWVCLLLWTDGVRVWLPIDGRFQLFAVRVLKQNWRCWTLSRDACTFGR